MNKLFILWTNDNPLTAKLMVFMYARNSLKFKWWDEVTIIIWGATAKLVHDNTEIQEFLKDLMASGVNVVACKACADELGATKKLLDIGVDVLYMGQPLTDIIKNESSKLITV